MRFVASGSFAPLGDPTQYGTCTRRPAAGERWIAGLRFAQVKRAFVTGEKTLDSEAFHEALNQLMQEDLQLLFSRRRYRSKNGMAINQVIYAVEKKAV